MRDEREPCEASTVEIGEKFRRWRWVRNFNDEASKMREQMEKQRRKRKKRTEIMREIREKFWRKKAS